MTSRSFAISRGRRSAVARGAMSEGVVVCIVVSGLTVGAAPASMAGAATGRVTADAAVTAGAAIQ